MYLLYTDTRTFSYVLCPPGEGFDTHRVYEALQARAAPPRIMFAMLQFESNLVTFAPASQMKALVRPKLLALNHRPHQFTLLVIVVRFHHIFSLSVPRG